MSRTSKSGEVARAAPLPSLLLGHDLLRACRRIDKGLAGDSSWVPCGSPLAQGCQELEMLQKLHPQNAIQPQPELMPNSALQTLHSAQPLLSLLVTG